MSVMITCQICKEDKPVDCTSEQMKTWQEGALIQKAMPNVPKDQRELLISGYCGPCFDALFAGDDDVEEGGDDDA